MTKEELDDNLGVIAQSGSLQFKNEHEEEQQDAVENIGQFGVGFYSAFMVAQTVTVQTKPYGSDTAYQWQSKDADGYTIKEIEKDTPGTEIILTLKENTDDENYDEFLEEYRLKELIKRYSDFIRYPIKMEVTETVPKEGEKEEYETVTEEETINSMVPIWRKNKSELTEEDYNNFYAENITASIRRLPISTSKRRALCATTRFCLFPNRRRMISTPGISKKDWNCIPTA
jgi:molecular chaperone HtpG